MEMADSHHAQWDGSGHPRRRLQAARAGATMRRHERHPCCPVHPAPRLDLEQGQRRPLRQHQPPHRRAHARAGAAAGPPPAAAVLAGHAQRREGHGAAGRTAGRRPQRRRIRRLAGAHRPGAAVRQRLRRRQPQLQDPGAAGLQRAGAGACVRVGRDSAVPGRQVRRLLPHRPRAARRVPVVAVLADGQRALPGRRLRPFLRLRAEQDRIRHRPLRDGSEAADGRAGPPPRRARVPGR